MREPTDNTSPAFLIQENPLYQPLNGPSLDQAVALLLKKGSLIEPTLSKAEAIALTSFMHLEHFGPGTVISFDAHSKANGRLMLILAGEANIRLRDTAQASRSQHSPVDQKSRWATATDGATLGLVHAFAGLSSRLVAQASTELFVASMSRDALHAVKQQQPVIALKFIEMLAMELALLTLDHERNLQAMNSVARSMQNMIDVEIGATVPAPLR